MTTSTKNNLSNLFKMAWNLVKHYGMKMAEALRKAWGIAKLRKAMKEGIVKFYFQKVDGTIREAWGTLKQDLLPASTGESKRKSPDSVVPYFDTEKQDFRCFKIANFMKMA